MGRGGIRYTNLWGKTKLCLYNTFRGDLLAIYPSKTHLPAGYTFPYTLLNNLPLGYTFAYTLTDNIQCVSLSRW